MHDIKNINQVDYLTQGTNKQWTRQVANILKQGQKYNASRGELKEARVGV
jgi:hypothetical protein